MSVWKVLSRSSTRRPSGLRWRAGYWFTTIVVGCGIAIDLLVYSIIIPVIPFQLESLGYNNASALTGWLLFAYSGGLLGATIPVAQISERYNERRWLLIAGFIILIASQIMFMEAPNYATMCVARIIQGIGSAIVWTVGLALLADGTPEQIVGQQLGFAMIGFTVGLTMGPPLGGALYGRFGFRGPFLFGIIFSFLDLVGRLIIIERKDALQWGFDPLTVLDKPSEVEASTSEQSKAAVTSDPEANSPTAGDSDAKEVQDSSPAALDAQAPLKQLPLLTVIGIVCRQPRALAASFITLIYGLIYASQEPSVPVYLNDTWDLSPGKIGLVFIAAALPSFVASPITGYITDKKGGEFIGMACLLLALPWSVVIVVKKGLALFTVSFALMHFFLAGVVAPLTTELAAVARGIDGVGYAHVYAAYNLAYGIGSTLGPIVGGQMYDNLSKGWLAVCLFATGLLALGSVVAMIYVGEKPLAVRAVRLLRNRRSTATASIPPNENEKGEVLT